MSPLAVFSGAFWSHLTIQGFIVFISNEKGMTLNSTGHARICDKKMWYIVVFFFVLVINIRNKENLSLLNSKKIC